MCGHWRFQVKYVFRYLEMILRNGDGLRQGIEWVHRRKESRVFYLVPWDWG